MSGYCDLAPGHPVHGDYHDREYGFPQRDESDLFERLILEINQAGLSWETILRKREGFRRAYGGFDVDTVAAYGEADRLRLLEDAGIIRNRLKVDAAIHNAQVVQRLRASHGGFAQWLDAHVLHEGEPRDKAGWVNLFKQTFRFTGGEITNEFLMSLSYLPGAHRESCPAYRRIERIGPYWKRTQQAAAKAGTKRTAAGVAAANAQQAPTAKSAKKPAATVGVAPPAKAVAKRAATKAKKAAPGKVRPR
ncbi:DNA-3-methyladenine glycosylase I [Lysobacter enzymogenes]|uniref:DNA-3-methyladenine glycosylase I n=1 Tax=Lysobacter enzymogenes TaxID=69 RepID=A0A0S2DDA2_LYSEN|nr:DNA-3-methyladenine glycosylase I [Lysobacter enzymogenes]